MNQERLIFQAPGGGSGDRASPSDRGNGPRIFYVIYLPPSKLRDRVDLIRLLANPNERWRAHLTVRGPFERRVGYKVLERLNRTIAGARVSVNGADMFHNGSNFTVYLRCRSSELKQVWKKRDYPFNPHITLYDGRSEQVAQFLLSLLLSYKPAFEFKVVELSPLESRKGMLNFDLAWTPPIPRIRDQVFSSGRELRRWALNLSDLERRRQIQELMKDLALLGSKSRQRISRRILVDGADATEPRPMHSFADAKEATLNRTPAERPGLSHSPKSSQHAMRRHT